MDSKVMCVLLNGSFEYFPANQVYIIAMENKHHKHLLLIAMTALTWLDFPGPSLHKYFSEN